MPTLGPVEGQVAAADQEERTDDEQDHDSELQVRDAVAERADGAAGEAQAVATAVPEWMTAKATSRGA